MSKLQLDPKLKDQFKDLFTQAGLKLSDFQKQLNNGIVDTRGLKKFETTGRELSRILDQISKKTQSLSTANLPQALYSGDATKLAQAQQALQDATDAYNNMTTAAGAYRTEADILLNTLKNQQDALKSNAGVWGRLTQAIEKGDFSNIKSLLNDLGKTNLKNTPNELEATRNAITHLSETAKTYKDAIISAEAEVDTFNATEKEKVQILAEAQQGVNGAVVGIKNLAAAEIDSANAAIEAEAAIEQFSNKIKQLLSYGSGIALLRRSIRNAYNTIKELDAAMTETATVTEYSVGQMWNKLDDYTTIANELGATTLGTYKTITLFFQQGLNEAQALSLATETMKMARVAGIDYAEATEYMTSALRGFNMELDETSATRVNDVYSELAKITAADTNQIAIAMSKVASLANSANMELETTSAFLSQIIETTQEAPETAGTALKTIIARFSEVKKLFSEGDITGSDENGDVIDVNKIGAALRNVGIDLNQYIAGNVGLDQIFLELAEKWDSLSLVQQRYIATQAAGSRQQSRFIAMMQNYSRTMELVDAAYSSAGSGQEQFEKTLESLEAKLNNLHNAWNSFSMSIANSDIIKGAVDLFTSFLTAINNLTDAFGPLSGAIKIFLGFGIFKTGNTLLGGQTGPLSKLSASLKTNKDLFKALSDTIDPLKSNFQTLGKSIRQFVTPVWELKNQIMELQAQKVNLSEQIKLDPDNAEAYKQQISSIENQIAQLNSDTSYATARTKAWGNAITIVGGAIIGLGAGLKNLGLKQQNEDLQRLGEVLSYIGASTVGIGQLISLLPKLAGALNLTMGATIGVAGAIGLLVAGIALAITSFIKYRQHTEELYNSSEKLRQKITDVASAVNDVMSLADGFKDLQKGSLDWYLQLDKVKTKLDEIYETDPEMKNFLKFDEETGEITFDREGYERHIKELRELQERANQVEQIRNTRNKNATQYENNLDYIQANEYNSKNTPYDYNQLASIFGLSGILSANDVAHYIDLANKSQQNWTEEQQRSFIAEKTGQTDIRNDELADYFIETFIATMLQSLKDTYSQQRLLRTIQDKKGQNIEQQNQELNDKELGEKYDVALVDDEDASALKTYWETLKELPPVLKSNGNLLKELALDSGQAIRNFDEFAKVIKDNKDNLKNLDKASLEYQKSLGAVTNASEKAFGTRLKADFVEDNLNDFIEAFVDGVPEAIDRIRDALFVEITPTLNDEDIPYIEGLLDYLSQDRSFQLTGTANLEPLFSAVNAGMTFTAEQLTRLQNQIQALGFEIAIDTIQNEDGSFKVKGIVLHDTAKTAARNYSGGSKKGGGGGSKQKEKAWENPYDQLYNLTELNEEAIRKRNLLEKQYNAILRDREGTQKQLTNNSLQELANLQQQLAYQRQLQAGREKQLNAVTGEMYTDSEGNRKSYAAWGVTQYASYNRATNAVEIDWDAIDKVTDQTKGKAIEDYIKRLEELQKLFEETDSNILDIEEEIDEINERGKTTYLDFEQEIYDAIVNSYQKTIDSFSSLNDTINEANDKIMNGLQEQIDLERQIRDNTKTEEEIGDKEARLAYLQRDTSGANAVEALRLQEEIANARQSYADSLIDQRLQQLQKDNDDAAEQRQMQITLMQEQLNHWAEQGVFWKDVDTLLKNAFDPETGELANNTALVKLLKGENNFKGLSEFGKAQWKDELVKKFMESMEGYGSWMMEKAEQEGTITQGGNTYTYDKSKKAWMLGNEAYSAVYDAASGQYIFTRTKSGDVKTGTIGEPKEAIKADTSGNSSTGSLGETQPKYKFSFNNGDWSYSIISTSQSTAVAKAVEDYKTFLRRQGRYSNEMIDRIVTGGYVQNFMSATRYASGGFADFTGPAWLDGSKSKPEAVLSAKQTELFISLRDMLERINQGGGFMNSFGNTYVDLDVNADIGSDYDVDSLVNRLKRDILESSNYRNVNALSRGH